MNDFSKHVLLAHQIAWHEDIAMNCSTGNLIFMGRVMMLFPPLSKKNGHLTILSTTTM